MRTHFGLRPGERVIRRGFPITSLDGTVERLLLELPFDELVCLLDSALHEGWVPQLHSLRPRQRSRFDEAFRFADGRSESPLETLLRLLLVRAGIPPEVLQLQLFDRDGVCFARLDLAWPSRRLAVEADGREHHDKLDALYNDRRRQNLVSLAGWAVLRFTWKDVLHSPGWVVEQVRAALAAAGSEVS